jgi:hypothetical protein
MDMNRHDWDWSNTAPEGHRPILPFSGPSPLSRAPRGTLSSLVFIGVHSWLNGVVTLQNNSPCAGLSGANERR